MAIACGTLMTGANRYIQMSGMVLGSMIEADARLRAFEERIKMERRRAKQRAYWEAFERTYGKDDDE